MKAFSHTKTLMFFFSVLLLAGCGLDESGAESSTQEDQSSPSDSATNDDSATPVNAGSELILQENTDSFCFVDGVIESEHAGYTGDGYSNTVNEADASVAWSVNASAGNYLATLRYADGGNVSRPGVFYINNQRVNALDANTSGSWESYIDSQSVSVYLNNGVNQIVLKATTTAGLPNIDYLKLQGSTLGVGDCTEPDADEDADEDSDENNDNGSAGSGSSSSAQAPTAEAAQLAGANSEPLSNGYPSFISNTVSDATVVDSLQALQQALDDAMAGDVIYIRQGTYQPSSTITLSQSGTEFSAIVLSAYPGDERPVFDFSRMSENSGNRGFDLKGHYWHVYGFDIKRAGDNGMYLRSSHNTIEFMAFYENADTGLQIDQGAAYNFIKNSDAYYNADSSLENADGFAAKLGVGTGNYFYGCRAWQNLDDGFDGYLRDNDDAILTTWEYSWMIRNGYLQNGSAGDGDGNGFKTGGSDDKDLAHNGVYINTIAAENLQDGFDQNSNRGDLIFHNAIAYGNNRNFSLSDGSSRILNSLEVKNSISLNTNSSDKFGAHSSNIANNSWQVGGASTADFNSVDVDELLGARQADGSLPVVQFFNLVSDSHLIDTGVDVGLSFQGSAPDIGSFESPFLK